MALKFLACTIRPSNPGFADSLLENWYEYEAGETQASLLVRQMDKLECMDQAFLYEERSGLGLGDFMALKEQITLPELKPWLQMRLQDYENLKARKNANILVVFVSGKTGHVLLSVEADHLQEDLVSVRGHSVFELQQNSISITYALVICYGKKQSLQRPPTETSFRRASANRCFSQLN